MRFLILSCLTLSVVFASDRVLILTLPIASSEVKFIEIEECDDSMVDLDNVANPRIKSFEKVCRDYKPPYFGYSQIRKGVYKKLLKMLDHLPKNIGIAYAECYRPVRQQKKYFDKKFKEMFAIHRNSEKAYTETCKHVSPFVGNIPTHCTGAAIDMSLFNLDTGELIDMGKFDTIYGHNNQEETFSKNITRLQKRNRRMLLKAASRAGLVNYAYEWWHYSYGDKAWAYATRNKRAIYGLKDKDDPILKIKKDDYIKTIMK